MTPRLAAAALGLLALAGPALADPRPAVVELFTSEGCSSCPPAEALLGELARRPDVVALAWHVDYWNNGAWRDRFTMAEARPRQEVYQRRLDLDDIYTPQMVIDGTRDVIGSERPAVLAALAGRRDGVPVALARDGGDLVATIGAGADKADVLLVADTGAAETEVKGGENAGVRIREFGIIRKFERLGAVSGQSATYRIPLASLPADATMAALLVQAPGQGAMLGAATAALR